MKSAQMSDDENRPERADHTGGGRQDDRRLEAERGHQLPGGEHATMKTLPRTMRSVLSAASRRCRAAGVPGVIEDDASPWSPPYLRWSRCPAADRAPATSLT